MVAGNGNDSHYLSQISIWALAFGSVIGWGAFIMPGTTFLPDAGPLGTLIGIVLAAVMGIVICLNYSCMVQNDPGEHGSYGFTRKHLGDDHGFLAAWSLELAYISLLWANSTAFVLIGRYLFRDVFQWGFHYTVAGYDVYAGEVLSAMLIQIFFGLVTTFAKNIADLFRTVFAVILFASVVILFFGVVKSFGWQSMFVPPFSTGESVGLQILNIAILAPWLFVGFEVVAHSVDEVKFKVSKIFTLAGIAVLTGMLVYIMLALTGASHTPDRYANWQEYVSDLHSLSGMEAMPVFYNARKAMGIWGIILIGLAAFSALSTSVLGFHRAAARVLMHMAEGKLLPERFSKLNEHGIPVAASLLVLIVSIPMPFLGRTAVGWNADVSTLSVAIVYAYISICAYKTARENFSKFGMVCGVAGLLMSAFVFVLLLVPNIFAVNALAKESYFMLAVWSILGIIYYWIIFSKDRENRFGNSTIMWLMMMFLLFFSANVWVRLQIQDRIESNLGTGNGLVSSSLSWGSLLQMLIVVAALVIMYCLFNTMLKRVKELDFRVIKEQEHSKAKSDFLSNMSHDIRTPMNAIIGFTDLALLDVKDTYKTEDYLHKIKSSSDHLLALINNVLEMSRIESGKIELNYSKMDICAAFEELDTFVGKQAKDKKQNFIIDNSGVTDRFVLCDMLRLRQVLLNLASNAVKYTPEGGEIRISLRETPQEGGNFADYEIKVTDNGIGMSKEFADRIFEAFERENTSTISGIQGTGLGMTITKQIVDLMGGTINLKTELGKGSEFTVNLRLEICKGQTEDEELAAQEVDFTGKRLLLVDDIEINREIALMNLEMMGFEVEQAADGTEAVSMVKEHESGYYDAVLMDIQMPTMNGYDATRAIRKLEDSGRSNVPIIAMTANAFDEDKKNAEDAGMNAHVAKPINHEQINAVLKQVFEKR